MAEDAVPSPRLCVFCQKRPVQPKGEHLLSDWIRRGLPRQPPQPLTIRTATGEETRIETPYDVQVPCVCAKCNHGWMSALETRTKPALLPLIRGHSRLLSYDEQGLIACWLLLKSIVHVEVARITEVVPREHYDHIYRTRKHPQPVRRCEVSLAAYADSQHGLGDFLMLGMERPERSAFPAALKGYAVTLTIGKVILQMFATFGYDETLNLRAADHGIFTSALVPIWPIAGMAKWPPPMWIDDRTYFFFASAPVGTAPPWSFPPAQSPPPAG